MKKIAKRFRWLIVTDLDGTLLKTGATHKEFKIHKKNIDAINKLVQLGHKVAIVTGRPWGDTEKIYKVVGLKTIVGNYNGSYINDPNDSGFVPMQTTINRNILMEMLKESFMKNCVKNIIVEDAVSPAIFKHDDYIMDQFHIKDYPNIRTMKSKLDIPQNPYSVVLHFDVDKEEADEIMIKLKRKYGAALAMRFWVNSKFKRIYLEINAFSVNKAITMKKIAAYYNIPLHRTIAFGDGLNDIEMLSEVAYGVAMKNASDVVKSYAKDVTNLTNDEGGVGEYLEKFFKYDLKK